MATMTRERMKEIQSVPPRPTRYAVRTGQRVKGGAIMPYREDVVAQALAYGEKFMKNSGDWRHGWWPALAPLTPAERLEVRMAVRRFSVVAEAA